MKNILSMLTIIVAQVFSLQTALAADAPGDRDSAVNRLIARVVDIYGGAKAVEGVKGLHAAGDITAILRGDRGTYEYYFQRPGKLRVETRYQRSSETRILNNGRGYRGTDAAPLTEVNGPKLLAMLYQYNHIDLLYGLLKGKYSVSMTGREDINGNPAEVLHLADPEGPPMDAAVDEKTLHIVKVSGYFAMGESRTSLVSEFSDFRKAGDTELPYRIVNYAGGRKIAETVIRRYEINPAIPDALFAP